ncbi:hypothetical protein BDB00DRAFT_803765 [Zychaea mexicana]|uniref:uncharacterized protein n=1 Tax=Zychaea mexicana TaxID=64656 RepID=UPI0022FEBDBB|nr:uncharacterized protein BDB00DRAFT_803765 [Zychaea mexicana]KAI9497716.1 hypothetical protein BDB00DRAFT_803765 [Zychaea mexicana]
MMNDEERPSVSVRQRAAAINRNLIEEQRKSQKTINKRGSGSVVRAPWRSVGAIANTSLQPRGPVQPSTTRMNFQPQSRRSRIADALSDHNNSKSNRKNEISKNKMSWGSAAASSVREGSSGTAMLPRRPTSATTAQQINLKMGKRQLSSNDCDEDSLFSSKHRKTTAESSVPRREQKQQYHRVIEEQQQPRLSSTTHRHHSHQHHYAVTASALSKQRSPSINSAASSSHPILYDDQIANLYARYTQWQWITLDADESTDRQRMEEENRLFAMYDLLWELRRNHGSDSPTVIQIADRLKEFSTLYEELQDTIQGGGVGSLKLSDDLIQKLKDILHDLRASARDLDNGLEADQQLNELETDFRALEECQRIIGSVAQVEAENQSLSAIL